MSAAPIRLLVTVTGLTVAWQALVHLTGAPHYILPGPLAVATAVAEHGALLGHHLVVTLTEIALGLVIGVTFGGASAILIAHYRPARRWLLPLLIASQAIPVFALAPVLVLWLGYGLASKVAMAALIIYFPVASAFLDGLRRTEPGWLDLAHTMTETPGGQRARARFAVLRHVRVPAAMPALASGIRVATAVAPIGAVVGEWVGSSAGLGYLMLHANGRLEIDLMFAALLTLMACSLTLWFAVDAALRAAMPWQPDRPSPGA